MWATPVALPWTVLVDGGVGFDPSGVIDTARSAEQSGYDGIWSAETSHDPFLPLVLAAEHTDHLQLGTGIAVAFARNPMNLAVIANDLQTLSKGRFMLGLGSQIRPHIEKRYSMPWSHPAARMRELVLAIRAIWQSWSDGSTLAFRGDFYRHTLMTPMFNPGPNPYGNPKIFVAAVGETHDGGGRRGGRRHPGPRVHDRALPPRRHHARPRAGSDRAGRTRADIQTRTRAWRWSPTTSGASGWPRRR